MIQTESKSHIEREITINPTTFQSSSSPRPVLTPFELKIKEKKKVEISNIFQILSWRNLISPNQILKSFQIVNIQLKNELHSRTLGLGF
jgi:hypothetical protein